MYLYRHYDVDGVLLYVGISNRKLARIEQHRIGAAWFARIAYIEFQDCRDRDHAERAETWAIQTECPLFNVRKTADVLPMSSAEVGAALRLTLAEAYELARKGEIFTTIEPIEFTSMSPVERRKHRREWKRLAKASFAVSTKSGKRPLHICPDRDTIINA